MGCFDANCCLTGLPLQQYDPVRAALVVPSLYEESRGAQPWLFWTLPVQGQYNDYGSIEWEDIPEDQLQILELILNLTKPHFKKDERYTTRVSGEIDDLTPSQIWDYCVGSDLFLDPLFEYRQDKQLTPIMVWMCHDWAWEFLKEIQPETLLRRDEYTQRMINSINQFVTPLDVIQRRLDEKYGSEGAFRSNEEAEEEWRKLAWQDSTLIDDVVPIGLKSIIRALRGEGAFEYEEKYLSLITEQLTETVKVSQSMFWVRKGIYPMTIIGQQHEDFEYLEGWTKQMLRHIEVKTGKNLELQLRTGEEGDNILFLMDGDVVGVIPMDAQELSFYGAVQEHPRDILEWSPTDNVPSTDPDYYGNLMDYKEACLKYPEEED